MLTGCLPIICSPTGPGVPFGTWYLTLFDVTRVLCVAVSIWLLGSIGAAWRRSYPHGGQRDRYAALGLLALIVIGTEIENLGNIASYRLVLSIVAMLLAVRGLHRFDREQPAAPGGTPSG